MTRQSQRADTTPRVDTPAAQQIDEATDWLQPDETMLLSLFEGAHDAILWADADSGIILNCNRAAELLMGSDRAEIIGRHQSSLHPPEAAARYREMFRRRAKGSSNALQQMEIVRKDGQRVVVEGSASLVCIRGRNLAQGIFRDVTERTDAERRYQSLFAEMLDGFALHEIICDSESAPIDYRFLAVNPAFERMTGFKAADIVGRTVLEIMPEIEPRWIEIYGRVAQTGEPAEFTDSAAALDRHFHVKAFRTEPKRFACVFSDVTEFVRATEALQLGDIRLRLAQEAARAGTWEWDMRTNAQKWSESLWQLFDLDAGSTEPSFEALIASISPEDRPAVEQMLKDAALTGSPLECEWRVNTRDDSRRWLMARGRPVHDESGELTTYVGIVIDVTEAKRSRDRLNWTRRKLDEAHRIARIGVWDWQAETDTATWSRELYEMVGRSPELSAPTFAELSAFYTPESWDMLNDVVVAALETGKPFDVELAMVRDDGGICWTRTVGSASTSGDGPIRDLHGTVQDITSQKLAEEEIARHRRRLAEMAGDILSTGDRERRRIAVELHDGVGQALAAAKMTARQLAADPDERYEIREVAMERLVDLLDYSINGIRLLTAELSPSVLYELGLGPALGWLADDYRSRYGLECAVHVDPAYCALKSEPATLLFRVTRELLNNVQRHSGVHLASVEIACREDLLVLRVADEGCGFDHAAVTATPGSERFGLLSIREEIGLAGGTVEIDTAEGNGTRVDIRLPLDSHSGEA